MENYWSYDLKEEFYIKLYFGTNTDFEEAGLKRAYRDFSRTLRRKNQENWDAQRESTNKFLKKIYLSASLFWD